jgi:hypothetical protein
MGPRTDYGTVAPNVASTGVTAMTFSGSLGPPLQSARVPTERTMRTLNTGPGPASGKVSCT